MYIHIPIRLRGEVPNLVMHRDNICRFVAMVQEYITITVLDIIHRRVFYFKMRRLGEWLVSASSGGIYSEWPNGIQSPKRRVLK
jgi:hypothetical protein